MIGDQAVGKTALLVRYADKEFHEQLLPTIGIDFKIKVCRKSKQRAPLQPSSATGLSPARLSARCVQPVAATTHVQTNAGSPLADDRASGQEDTAADMGYGWAGTLSYASEAPSN